MPEEKAPGKHSLGICPKGLDSKNEPQRMPQPILL